MIGSPEPLRGVHYDKEKMEFTGIAVNGRMIKPAVTFSQTHYKAESGKERVITRVHDKVVPNIRDLMRHLSGFDLIIGADTNTRVIGRATVSVTGIAYSVVHSTPDPDAYYVEFPWHGVSVFRNCPEDPPAEKFGWMTVMSELNRLSENVSKKFALVSDHDLDDHGPYNQREVPILRGVWLPPNFMLMYGRSDGSTENLLNYLVKLCDRESTEILKDIETKGYFQYGDIKLPIGHMPVPHV